MAGNLSRGATQELAPSPPAPLLEAAGLTRHFHIGGMRGATLHAVDGVDLTIGQREIVAMVGESGSGKSTVARLLARVYRPSAGEVRFNGRDLGALRRRRDLLAYRGAVPMVFQDPYSSLNPVHTIGHLLERGLRLHRGDLDRRGRRAEAERVLEAVGLVPAPRLLARYPHELSGGQRQRVGFAQALSYRPSVILADEPVSMLDVSIRIGLLNLMREMCNDEGLSLLYITHDIASARYVATRIVVMYAGKLVETGATEDVLREPAHPYTRLLLSAVPDPRAPVSAVDMGEPPKVVDPSPGCRFRFRCPYAEEICAAVTPELRTIPFSATRAACHLAPLPQS
ncbi:MAG TPA: ABC transporter ATP-binding protein [Acidimicrobiales bacterium]|nr:ABC transporter ATP-binding protein [Acidimicrobiales bacterium]